MRELNVRKKDTNVTARFRTAIMDDFGQNIK